jgi:hypothetical protein
MAYKYFTEKLLSSDLNLADVFPIQQDDARNQVNASYNLFEIAQFIQDRTDNFKNTEQQYIDLDSAISEIINKWYKSQGKPNPFVQVSAVDEEFDSTNPRESAIVDSGKLKSKGTPASAPSTKKPKYSEMAKKFKADLEDSKELIYDEYEDDADKLEFRETIQKRIEADELMADIDSYFAERVEILNDLLKRLK